MDSASVVSIVKQSPLNNKSLSKIPLLGPSAVLSTAEEMDGFS